MRLVNVIALIVITTLMQSACNREHTPTFAAVGTRAAEAWRCTPGQSFSKNHEVVILKSDGTTGTIQYGGSMWQAAYSVEASNERWDFGELNNDGSRRFAHIVQPDGRARYYEFRPNRPRPTGEPFACLKDGG